MIFLIILVLTTACELDKGQPREVGHYKGLDVILQPGVPQQALSYDGDDLLAMLRESKNGIISRSLSTGEDETILTLEQLEHETATVLRPYPDFMLIMEGDETQRENQMRIIRSDFPGLTDEQIGEQIETIIEIYEQQAGYEVATHLSDLSDSEVARGMHTYFGEKMNTQELRLFLRHLPRIFGVKRARNHAESYSSEWGDANGLLGGNDKEDALRHGLLNVFLAKETYGYKSTQLWWAEAVANAHEYGSDNYSSSNKANQMDLHNNLIGRDVYSQQAVEKGWWIFKRVTSPTHDQLFQVLVDKLAGAYKFTEISELQGHRNQLVYFAGP